MVQVITDALHQMIEINEVESLIFQIQSIEIYESKRDTIMLNIAKTLALKNRKFSNNTPSMRYCTYPEYEVLYVPRA